MIGGQRKKFTNFYYRNQAPNRKNQNKEKTRKTSSRKIKKKKTRKKRNIFLFIFIAHNTEKVQLSQRKPCQIHTQTHTQLVCVCVHAAKTDTTSDKTEHETSRRKIYSIFIRCFLSNSIYRHRSKTEKTQKIRKTCVEIVRLRTNIHIWLVWERIPTEK